MGLDEGELTNLLLHTQFMPLPERTSADLHWLIATDDRGQSYRFVFELDQLSHAAKVIAVQFANVSAHTAFAYQAPLLGTNGRIFISPQAAQQIARLGVWPEIISSETQLTNIRQDPAKPDHASGYVTTADGRRLVINFKKQAQKMMILSVALATDGVEIPDVLGSITHIEKTSDTFRRSQLSAFTVERVINSLKDNPFDARIFKGGVTDYTVLSIIDNIPYNTLFNLHGTVAEIHRVQRLDQKAFYAIGERSRLRFVGPQTTTFAPGIILKAMASELRWTDIQEALNNFVREPHIAGLSDEGRPLWTVIGRTKKGARVLFQFVETGSSQRQIISLFEDSPDNRNYFLHAEGVQYGTTQIQVKKGPYAGLAITIEPNIMAKMVGNKVSIADLEHAFAKTKLRARLQTQQEAIERKRFAGDSRLPDRRRYLLVVPVKEGYMKIVWAVDGKTNYLVTAEPTLPTTFAQFSFTKAK